MILKCVSWNLLKGGIDAGDDARMRRQMTRIADERPDVVMLQELNGWDRDGQAVLHRAEELLGGMRGFLAPAERGFHLGVFIREPAGLRVVRTRHESRPPFWHGAACVITEADGFGRLVLASAHLAPASTVTRLAEAEAFKLIAEAGPSVSGGDWNAVPAGDPEPARPGRDPEHERRKLDRAPALALESSGLTDAAAHLRILTPTVGYFGDDRLAYRCDRFYTSLPAAAITGYHVIRDADDCSDHRPVTATFDLDTAAGLRTAS